MADTIVIVETTFETEGDAERITAILLEEKLVACVHLSPITSLYHWEGKLERGVEVRAAYKTASDRAEPLVARLAAVHPYDVPQVIVHEGLRASAAYADWARDCTR